MFVVYTSSPQSFWHQRLLSWMTTFQRTDVGGSGGRELRTQAGEVGGWSRRQSSGSKPLSAVYLSCGPRRRVVEGGADTGGGYQKSLAASGSAAKGWRLPVYTIKSLVCCYDS